MGQMGQINYKSFRVPVRAGTRGELGNHLSRLSHLSRNLGFHSRLRFVLQRYKIFRRFPNVLAKKWFQVRLLSEKSFKFIQIYQKYDLFDLGRFVGYLPLKGHSSFSFTWRFSLWEFGGAKHIEWRRQTRWMAAPNGAVWSTYFIITFLPLWIHFPFLMTNHFYVRHIIRKNPPEKFGSLTDYA